MTALQKILVIIVYIHLVVNQSLSKVYYIDSQSGSNKNNGLSASEAWSGVEVVRNTKIEPGDSIL
jgi:hypothetical protein